MANTGHSLEWIRRNKQHFIHSHFATSLVQTGISATGAGHKWVPGGGMESNPGQSLGPKGPKRATVKEAFKYEMRPRLELLVLAHPNRANLEQAGEAIDATQASPSPVRHPCQTRSR
jgi:hypothetical protein